MLKKWTFCQELISILSINMRHLVSDSHPLCSKLPIIFSTIWKLPGKLFVLSSQIVFFSRLQNYVMRLADRVSSILLPPLIKKFVHKFAYNSQFFCQVLLNLLPGRVWMGGSPPPSVYNLHSFNVSDEAANWNQALPFPSHSLNNKWWVEGKTRTFFLPSHFLERFILWEIFDLSFSKYQI